MIVESGKEGGNKGNFPRLFYPNELLNVKKCKRNLIFVLKQNIKWCMLSNVLI